MIAPYSGRLVLCVALWTMMGLPALPEAQKKNEPPAEAKTSAKTAKPAKAAPAS